MINTKMDTHIHTHYSPDANKDASFSAYVEKAKALGLETIVFTDHVDFDPAHPLFKVPIDYDQYIDALKQVKKTEKDIEVKLGVEIGYQSHMLAEIKDFLKRYPFEHVILSIHYMERKDLYTQAFFRGKTKKQAYDIYFKTLLEAVEAIDDFSVVGHLDYIPRYSGMGDYLYEDYKDIIDQILKTIIKKDKGIEINTSGFLTEGRQYPKACVVKRFIELGGKKIVLGSDSHRVSDLARYFSDIKW